MQSLPNVCQSDEKPEAPASVIRALFHPAPLLLARIFSPSPAQADSRSDPIRTARCEPEVH